MSLLLLSLIISLSSAINSNQIQSLNNRCLTEYWGRPSLDYCDEPDHQQWVYRPDTKAIMNLFNKKCLDIKEDWDWNGQPIVFFECTGATNQQWIYDETTQQIRNVAGGKCLDVHFDDWIKTTGGDRIQIWDCNNGQNQKFIKFPITAKTDKGGCTLSDFVYHSQSCTPSQLSINAAYISPNGDLQNWHEWGSDWGQDSVEGVVSMIGSAIDLGGGKGLGSLISSIVNFFIDIGFNGINTALNLDETDPLAEFGTEIGKMMNNEIEKLKQCIGDKIYQFDAKKKIIAISAFGDDLNGIYKWHSTETNDFINELKELVTKMNDFVGNEFKANAVELSVAEYSANLLPFRTFMMIYEQVTLTYLKTLKACALVNQARTDTPITCESITVAAGEVYGEIQTLKTYIIKANTAIGAEYSSIKALSGGSRACLSGTCDSSNQCDAQLVKEYRMTIFNPQPYSIKQFGFWPSDAVGYKYNFGMAEMDTTDMNGDFLTKITLDMSSDNVPMICYMWDMIGHYCDTKIVEDTIGDNSEVEVVDDDCCINLNEKARTKIYQYKQDLGDWSQNFYHSYIHGVTNFEKKIQTIQADAST